jgi:hypothetical protein
METFIGSQIEEVSSKTRIRARRVSHPWDDNKNPILPQLNEGHVSDIESISDQEEQVFNSPYSPRRSDLWQGTSHPDFDRIAEQQRHAYEGGNDLIGG